MTFIDTFYDRHLYSRARIAQQLYFVDQPFWTVDTIFTEILNLMPKFSIISSDSTLRTLTKRWRARQSVLNELTVPVPLRCARSCDPGRCDWEAS